MYIRIHHRSEYITCEFVSNIIGDYTPARLMTIDIDFGGHFDVYDELKNKTDGFNADKLGEILRVTPPLSTEKLIFMIYGGFAFTNIIGESPEIIQSGTQELFAGTLTEDDFNVYLCFYKYTQYIVN